MRSLLLALLSILCSVGAQFLLKRGVDAAKGAGGSMHHLSADLLVALVTQRHLLLGLALYGLSAVIWLAVLAEMDVSKAYPLVGVGFALTVCVGWLMGENVSALRVAGVFLICAGVAMVGRS